MNNEYLLMDIDQNRMWAMLSITKPDDPEEFEDLDADYLEEFLREDGICSGFLYDNLQKLVDLAKNGEYDREIMVAQGKEPVQGNSGEYEFFVKLEDDHAKPKINEDGSVDYHNSLSLAMVANGQMFAKYHPPTMGEYGFTIYSEMINPIKGKDLKSLRGKGFRVEENTDDTVSYIATMDGRIARDGDRIIIENVYIVKGNLDIKEGNVHFNGDVEVRGDVASGMSIETTGSIFVSGHVGACKLVAGKNVTIRHGLQGKDKSSITAGGDVACSFIERADIHAEGSVYAESILQSDIVARNEVVVMERKGIIIGGSVTATLGIKAKNVGNDINTSTQLIIGVPRGYLDRVADLRGTVRKIHGELQLLETKLREIDMLPEGMKSESTEAMRMKCLRAKVVKSTELRQAEEELKAREDEMNESKTKARISIMRTAYPGTVINMWREAFAVKTETIGVEFRLTPHGVEASGI